MKIDSNEFITSHINEMDKSRFVSFTQNTLTQSSLKTKKSPISARESTCLSWAAVGKTANEIATILKISKHTVHFHTKNAIKKLNAANKTHAVTKSLLMGYITISRKIV